MAQSFQFLVVEFANVPQDVLVYIFVHNFRVAQVKLDRILVHFVLAPRLVFALKFVELAQVFQRFR